MMKLNLQQLHKFIDIHKLDKVGNIILFDALVSCYVKNVLHSIGSQIQIITLPNEMALYILEFLNEDFNMPEMYSTTHFYFTCTAQNTLEIREDESASRFIISIVPN